MTRRDSDGGFREAIRHAFAIPKEQEFSTPEQDWLERIADRVVRRGLAAPAVFMLQSAKPLSFVGSQVLAFFRPIVSLLFPPEQCDRVIELLSRRDTAEALLRLIEERELRRRGRSERP